MQYLSNTNTTQYVIFQFKLESQHLKEEGIDKQTIFFNIQYSSAILFLPFYFFNFISLIFQVLEQKSLFQDV